MNLGQVLGIILSLSVSGSVFTNRAIGGIALALPDLPKDELTKLITGASGHFYQSLTDGERAVVVGQITEAIKESFCYLVGITAIGFTTSLFLSVSISPSYKQLYIATFRICLLIHLLVFQPRKLFLSGGAAAV